jgi:hypothetical protein
VIELDKRVAGNSIERRQLRVLADPRLGEGRVDAGDAAHLLGEGENRVDDRRVDVDQTSELLHHRQERVEMIPGATISAAG